MDWLETKYIGFISSRLDKFKKKSGNSYNFRCPICGDSKKSRTKARGWIFDKSGSARFYCHNCAASMSLGGLVKHLDPQLYSEMKLERLRDGAPGFIAPANTPQPVIARLNQEIVAIVHRPDIKQSFLTHGQEAAGSTPEQFGATVRAEIQRAGKVIRDAGIRVE